MSMNCNNICLNNAYPIYHKPKAEGSLNCYGGKLYPCVRSALTVMYRDEQNGRFSACM